MVKVVQFLQKLMIAHSGDDHSDSEHENSESIDESIDDYDYTNENGENSNFMDEYLD